MRVLRVTQTMDPSKGGVVEAVNQAATAFNEIGDTMDVLCLDAPCSPWLHQDRNYKIYAIGKGRTSYGISLTLLTWVVKKAKSYEIVVLDGIWQFYVLSGYLLRIMNIPFCVFTHGMLDPYFNKNKFKFIKKLPFWFISERNIIAMADAAIFTCQEEARLAKRSFPFFRCNPKITTLGVDSTKKNDNFLSNAFISEFPQLKGKKFGLFLSRISRKKGIDLLIDAIDKADFIPEDFVFVIAGPDTEDLKSKLVEKICLKGLTNKFFWVGMLSGDIKWGAYTLAEFFILPSHQENFGIVVAEALSTGTPVLISNKVNIWQEIEKSSGGIVGEDSVQGVLQILKSWFALNRIEKEIYSASALECFQMNFDRETARKELRVVLKGIIEQ